MVKKYQIWQFWCKSWPFSKDLLCQSVHGQDGYELDGRGWNAIDRMGGWNSLLVQFNMMEEVPYKHEEVWVWAFGHLLITYS